MGYIRQLFVFDYHFVVVVVGSISGVLGSTCMSERRATGDAKYGDGMFFKGRHGMTRTSTAR